MSSPCIDLDMDLTSSPVPLRRDDGNDDDTIGDLPTRSAADDRTLNGNALNDQATTLGVNAGDKSRSMHSNSNHALESTTGEEIHDDDERMIANGKTTQHYEAMTAMVESWMGELHAMNVKNSILLDDLVKLGADSVEECS
jgi:hypothetical protein